MGYCIDRGAAEDDETQPPLGAPVYDGPEVNERLNLNKERWEDVLKLLADR